MRKADMLAAVPGASPFSIRVPGSIANLGPGFDTLAVAVNLYLELRVTPLPGPGGELAFHFPGGAPAGPNFVERAFRHMLEKSALHSPPLQIEVRSEIPAKSGIGSSAAATVAGLRLFSHVCSPLTDEQLLNEANHLEGHPDNVAACLLGGLAICMERNDGSISAAGMPWPEAIQLFVITPQYALSTREARSALPSQVPMRDAVRNLQRVAFLTCALGNGDLSRLREAFSDSLHQPYREPLVPGLKDLLQLQHADMLGASLSGAGPSLVAFSRGRSTEVQQLVESTYRRTGLPFTSRWLTAHPPGGTDAAR